ncbi:MAG: stage V sporulation protein S [Chloroflexota bacterium]|nr:stage V sporulation protein S [Chloroflexota bacterium]
MAARNTVEIDSASSGDTGIPEQLHATEILKVSTRSRPSAVAGAIAGVMRARGEVDVQAIGAGATNQAIKAIAIARVYLVDDGIDVCVVPSFIDLLIDGEERTALRLFVQRRLH